MAAIHMQNLSPFFLSRRMSFSLALTIRILSLQGFRGANPRTSSAKFLPLNYKPWIFASTDGEEIK